MWLSLFTVALVIALGLGAASIILESSTKAQRRRYVRRRVTRARG